ncbi:hypothetical protein G6F66_015093 [Rhizopus arrhizus]|nr:hypothetical protein G6F66_015093 [Rhizopus arrhizus]
MAGWELGLGHRHFIGKATLDVNLAYRKGTGAFNALRAPEEAFGEVGPPEPALHRQLARAVESLAAGAAGPLLHRWPLHRAWLRRRNVAPRRAWLGAAQ